MAAPYCSSELKRDNLRQWAQLAKVMREFDTLFWMQGRSRPEYPIFLASLLREPLGDPRL